MKKITFTFFSIVLITLISLSISAKSIDFGKDFFVTLNNNGTVILSMAHEQKEFVFERRIVSIAAGYHFCLFLDETGKVFFVGEFSEDAFGVGYKEHKEIIDIDPIIKIAAKGTHALLLTQDQKVLSFGKGTHGELGHGNNFEESQPKIIENIPPIVDMDTGTNHSLLVDNEGGLWGFGCNNHGQLGIEHNNIVSTPQKIDFNQPIKTIIAGELNSFIIDMNRNVYASGANFNFQLGLDHNQNVFSFTQIESMKQIALIAPSIHNTFFLDINANLTIKGCGGLGANPTYNFKTIQVLVLHNSLEMISSPLIEEQTCAFLNNNGAVYMIGKNRCFNPLQRNFNEVTEILPEGSVAAIRKNNKNARKTVTPLTENLPKIR